MLPARPTMAGGASSKERKQFAGEQKKAEVAEIDQHIRELEQQIRELEKKAEEQGAVSQIRALPEMKLEAAPAPAPVIMSRKRARTEETGESGGSQQGGGITCANAIINEEEEEEEEEVVYTVAFEHGGEQMTVHNVSPWEVEEGVKV